MSETEVIEQTTVEQQPQPMVVTQSTFSTPLPKVEEVTQVAEAQPNTEIQNTEAPEIQENEATVFNVPNYGEPQANEAQVTEATNNNQQQATKDWREAIKDVDRKEVLKALGLKDFTTEFVEYYENGNDPYAYLQAKAFNYDNVPDIDIIKQDIKEQYPNLSADDVDRLVNRKYSLNSLDDDEAADGQLMLKTDAYQKRQLKKEEQKKFQIPTVEKPQEAVNKQQEEQYRAKELEQAQKVQEFQKMVSEHEATKNLLTSKRVTVNLGEDVKPFNFPIDNPESLLSVAFGKNWSRAIAVNPQEADESKLIPDIAKLTKIAYIAMNPNYEKDLFNYGVAQGQKRLIDEGKNAVRPSGTASTVVAQSITDVIKNGGVKVSTYGSN